MKPGTYYCDQCIERCTVSKHAYATFKCPEQTDHVPHWQEVPFPIDEIQKDCN